MKKSISIIDYGLCNIFNVANAFRYIGCNVNIIDSPNEVDRADHLVLPGVGAFKDGMDGLVKRNLTESIVAHAQNNKPFIGICLGMQMMLNTSFEFGKHEGLGIISGQVKKIPNINNNLPHKIPHIGWNKLDIPSDIKESDNLLKNQDNYLSMYFIHSYHVLCANQSNIIAQTTYNDMMIVAMIKKNNIYGCQFHPEKSGSCGLQLLVDFTNL